MSTLRFKLKRETSHKLLIMFVEKWISSVTGNINYTVEDNRMVLLVNVESRSDAVAIYLHGVPQVLSPFLEFEHECV